MIFAQSANNWFARLLRARHPRRVQQRSERAPPRLAIVGSERWLLDRSAQRRGAAKYEEPNQDERFEISQVRMRPTFAVGAALRSSWPGSELIVVRVLPSKVWLAVVAAILTTTPAAASPMLAAELATTTPAATRVADHRVSAGRENSAVAGPRSPFHPGSWRDRLLNWFWIGHVPRSRFTEEVQPVALSPL
jgi:hypothetical protein